MLRIWNLFLQFKEWIKPQALEILLFAIALGNANVLHIYLIATGSEPTWQLIIAVYATELLIVWASLWGTTGLMISTVLFTVSTVSIRHQFGENWFGHLGFSLAIYCGSIGNYVRRGGYRDLQVIQRLIWRRTVEVLDLSGLSVADIRDKFFLTLDRASLVKQMRDAGITITTEIINALKS